MKNKPINDLLHWKWAITRIETLASVAAILSDTLEDSTKIGLSIISEMRENDLRVQGNRSPQSDMTYEDLRLMTIATFKMLLKRLEGQEGEDDEMP